MAALLPEPAQGPSRRPTTSYSLIPELSKPFILDPASRSYKHQYSNIYFVRLVELRPIVEVKAQERWAHVRGKPPLLPRILNLQRSQLCYIVGTVYMEMPLKPNVLEDLAQKHWIAPPAPRAKFYSAQDAVHLEDESGRVRLVGQVMRRERDRPGGGLVTGVIMAALGMETTSGDFEVIDLCFAGLPPLYHPPTPVAVAETREPPSSPKGKHKAPASESIDDSAKTWVAFASGLSVGSSDAPLDLKTQLLVEWLTGETGAPADLSAGPSGRIARLVLVGNSLAPPSRGESDRQPKRLSAPTGPSKSNTSRSDPAAAAAAAAAHPTKTLAALLSDVLASGLPITLLPGPLDPSAATLPQPALPKVMLGGKAMAGLESTTNPAWLEVGGCSVLATSGQTIDDFYKYLPDARRLAMAARTLVFHHLAPTAPDTLWIYPFPDQDPFVLLHRPEIYVVGNQPEFETGVVGPEGEETRIVLVPSFTKTGQVALVCLETLECKMLELEVPVWEGDMNGEADGDEEGDGEPMDED